MEIRPEPIRPARRIPLQLLVAAVLLTIAAVAVGASLVRPVGVPATLAAGASAAPSTAPDASGRPGWNGPGRGNTFGFGFGFGARPGGPGGFGGGRGDVLATITISAISGADVSLTSANGWKRTIDTTGVAITRAGVAITVGDLKVGDRVSIAETRASDGTYTVKGLAVVLDQAGGTVTRIDAGSITVTRGTATTTITTDAATVYRRDGQTITRDALAVGQRVTAAGTKAADGSLQAAAVDVEPDVVMGTVTKIAGSTLTISTFGGGTATVVVNAKTAIRVMGKDPAVLSDITVNSMIVAQGAKDAKGVLTASSIRGGSWRPATTDGRGWHGWGASPAPSAGTGTSG